ncbi:MAG: hypothetical protein R6V44_17745 [Paracoccaceae bacterium]
MDAVRSLDDLAELLRLPKRVDGTPRWDPQHKVKRGETPPANLRLSLEAPLSVEGVTMEGLRLRAAAPKFEPGRKVAIQLMLLHRGKWRPFTRIDWRGPPHTNRRDPGFEHYMRDVGETHVHRLCDNAFLGWPGVVTSDEDLPNAAPLEDPGDFAALLSLAAGELYVENLTDIGEPPWEASFTLR